MASFTDKTPPQFNPYIQQLPVEAMTTVGMAKQKAYEEGVQKIQTEVDNIAGLDVVRDVDRAYLQSKLNELGNRIRTVSAGDFSNFQLVNSVSGMTKQVVRDEGVQNAVASTAKLRKEQTFMEEERKKGELNPANEYVFNKQASNWMNSADLKQGFNAKYDKYFDVDKYTRETFAALKPDGFTIDQIFKTDGNGNPIFNKKTGGYELSTTMSKLKKEGMFPEKVQQTIDHIFSDPRVSKQLQISGQYTYRGMSNQDLASRLISTKDTQINVIDKNIMDLTMKKSMIQDGPERVKLQKDIDDLVDTKNQTLDNYNNLITNIGENADSVRGMLYKAEEKNKFKGMYTSVIEERTVHENPAWRANFDMQKEANDMAEHRDKMKMDAAKMAQDERIAIMKMSSDYNIAAMKAEADAKADADTYTTADITTPDGLIDAFEKEGQSAWDTYTKSTDEVLLSTGVISEKGIKDVMASHPGMTKQEAMKYSINDMAKKKGMTPAGFRADQYAKSVKMLNDNNGKLTPVAKQMKDNVENARAVFDDYRTKKALIDKAAPMKGMESLNVAGDFVHPSAPNGVVRKQDQFDLALIKRGDSWFASAEEKKSAKDAKNRLVSRGYVEKNIDFILDNSYKAALVGEFADPVRNKNIVNFNKIMDAATSQEFNSSMEKRAEAIKAHTNFAPSVSKSLDTGEEKIDKGYRQSLKTYVGRYKASGQNESPGFVDNAEKMTKILEDKDEGSVEMTANKVNGQIVNKAIFYDAKGEKVGEMTVTPDQAASVGFRPENKYSTPEMRYVENKIAVTGNGSTAYGDVRSMDTYAYNDVALTKAKFPKLQGSAADVKANIQAVDVINADGSSSTMYYNYMYVNDNGFKFIKPLGTPKPTVEEAIEALQDVDASQLTTLINEQKRQR